MKQYKYKINGNPYNVVINDISDEVAEVEVNGTSYTVEIEPKAKKITSAFKKPAQAGKPQPDVKTPVAKQPSNAGSSALRSPLPGIILEVSCRVGDSVKKGQKVLILEAMKMENNIIADKDGTVKDIKVSKGDSVLEGAELLTIA